MNESNEHQSVRNSKKVKKFIILGVVVAIGLTALFLYRGYARTHVSTDDAFVDGSVHMIAPRVAGTVAQILVSDNQWVKAGDLLVTLDPEPFQKTVDEAAAFMRSEEGRLTEARARVTAQEKRVSAMKASLASTRAAEKGLFAAVSARQAEVLAKSASLKQSQLDLSRAEKLSDQEVIPKSRHEQAQTALEVATATLTVAEEMKNQAQVVKCFYIARFQ
jgi:membrane fusion protein (multidrug efflux system)